MTPTTKTMKEQTLDEKLEHILLKLMINSETEYPDSKAISEIKAAVLADVHNVLSENLQIQIAGYYNDPSMTKESRNILIKEYQDLIAIFKARSGS